MFASWSSTLETRIQTDLDLIDPWLRAVLVHPAEPIPVYESMEVRPGGARPAGVVIANLTQDDRVAVVGIHDDKDPTAYEIRLANGERGWIFVVDDGNRVVSWAVADRLREQGLTVELEPE